MKSISCNSSSSQSVDDFERSLKEYLSNETKESFQSLLQIVLNEGYTIDFELKGGSTLLHHSVSLNLTNETVLILNYGGRILKNNQNKTPIDIAIERGNQFLLQLLRRSNDYYNYLKSKNNLNFVARVLSSSSETTENLIYGVCKYAWSPTYYLVNNSNEPNLWGPSFRLGEIYEDYLDWNDAKLVEHLRVFIYLFIYSSYHFSSFILPIYFSNSLSSS